MARRKVVLPCSILVVLLMLAGPAAAKQYFDHAETLATSTSKTESYSFTIEQPGTQFVVRCKIQLTSGLIYVRLLDATGASKNKFSARVVEGSPISEKLDPGNYAVEAAHRKRGRRLADTR